MSLGVPTDTFTGSVPFSFSSSASVSSSSLRGILRGMRFSQLKKRLVAMNASFVMNPRAPDDFVGATPTGAVLNLRYSTSFNFSNFSWLSAYLSGDDNDNPFINCRVITNAEEEKTPQDWPFSSIQGLRGLLVIQLIVKR